MRHLWIPVFALAACESAHSTPAKRYYTDQPPRVALGDCAPPGSQLVSGPEALVYRGYSPPSAGLLGYTYVTAKPPAPPSPNGDIYGGLLGNEASEIDAHAASLPGPGNPLLGRELAACLSNGTHEFAVLAIDLDFDAAGHVANAKVHGTDDASLIACATSAAKKAVADERNTTLRCGISIGSVASSELPTLDLAVDAIRWNGNPLAAPGDALTQADWKIAAIANAFRTWNARPSDGVLFRGPALLRPLDTTPMKLVTRALATAFAAGGDIALAANRNGQWQPLRNLDLPAAPMTIGTGGTWNGKLAVVHSERVPLPPGVGDSEVALTVYVRKSDVVVGVTRIDQVFNVRGRDWASLDRVLAERASWPYLKGRHDATISAEDDVHYGDVVKAIDALDRAGFTDWTLTDPGHLEPFLTR